MLIDTVLITLCLYHKSNFCYNLNVMISYLNIHFRTVRTFVSTKNKFRILLLSNDIKNERLNSFDIDTVCSVNGERISSTRLTISKFRKFLRVMIQIMNIVHMNYSYENILLNKKIRTNLKLVKSIHYIYL
jgi:hypothetical protein